MFEQLQKEIEKREKGQDKTSVFAPATEQHKQFYALCKNIPFYVWNLTHEKHDELAKHLNNRCCYNHLIGLPVKQGVKHHIYDYERLLFDELMKSKPDNDVTATIIEKQQYKHLAVVMATGLGISEFVLRWLSWLCLRNDELKGKRIVIITGNNIALAIDLIRRLKALFLNPDSRYPLIFDSKETVLDLNGCTFQAFPSHHLSAARGLTDVVAVFMDEASFFELNQSDDARDVAERYIAKSDPYLLIVSTPNKPSDLMHRITEQKEEDCIYKRVYLPYNVGVGNIFTVQEIEKAKRSLSFEREYNLKFSGLVGNVFLEQKTNLYKDTIWYYISNQN